MPYLPARLTAVTTLADLKISGILSADSINHKIAMNSSAGAATDANDHFLFEDGGTDGGGKNAGDNLLLEDVTNANVPFANINVGSSTSGHFLKSQGAGSVPVFAEAGGGAHAQVVTASSTTVTTTTSAIPQDNTIPQSSEGVEVLTLAITPTNASSVLNIFVHVPVWGTAGGGVGTGFALFKDSGSNAIAAGTCSTGGIPNASFSLHHNISAGSTSSQTFKLRIGAGGSGTVGINSNSAATRTYGGVAATTMTIFEVLP